jgi:hypothetical protein
MQIITATCVVAVVLFCRSLPAYAQTFSDWSTAVNLGPVINTSVNEGCPFIAKDDLTLYVVTTRPDGFGGRTFTYLTGIARKTLGRGWSISGRPSTARAMICARR